MTAGKIQLLFAVFCYFLLSKRQFVLRELGRRLNFWGSHILTRISAFVSAPQRMPRTANMCGNILPCFAPPDGRGDRTNELHLLELLHTSYISLLNHPWKGRVFYSVDKCFEARADSRNTFDKQILKSWTPCLSVFYCVILRATLA